MLNKEEQSQQKPQFNLTSFFFIFSPFVFRTNSGITLQAERAIKKKALHDQDLYTC